MVPAKARTRPVKVAAYTHTLLPSGAELALSRTAPSLRSEDFELTVVHGADGKLRQTLEEHGVPLVQLPLPASLLTAKRSATVRALFPLAVAYGRYVLRLSGTFRREGFALVHANSLKSAFLATPAALLAGIPVVWHLRDQLTRAYLGRRAAIVRTVCRWTSSGVVANSRSTLLTAGRYPRPSAVAYSPLSPDVIYQEREQREGPLQVLMLGRLVEWKGQLVVLRALARTPDSWSTAVFAGGAFFGEEAYERSLVAEIEALGLTGRVRLAGHVDDPGRLLAEADVLVHASVIPEPLGQVVLEGVAAGLPVLAANAGGPSEILRHEETALLHTPGDADELAAHLTRLADDPALRRRLVDNGRDLVARFGADESARAITGVWRQVLDRRSTRRRPGRSHAR